jgi:hypothetical protein
MYENRARARRMAEADKSTPDEDLVSAWLLEHEPTQLPPGYAQGFRRFDDHD